MDVGEGKVSSKNVSEIELQHWPLLRFQSDHCITGRWEYSGHQELSFNSLLFIFVKICYCDINVRKIDLMQFIDKILRI